MKKFIALCCLLIAAAGGRAELPQPNLIAQLRFAGSQRISADKNFPAFTNQFACPEFKALSAQTTGKLAAWLPGWLKAKAGISNADAAKIRPLIDDLQSAEWTLEARADDGDKIAVGIAIRLEASRAQIWQANLKPLFPSATFLQTNDWLIFDSGTASIKLVESLRKTLSSPVPGWGSVDVNWPRLARWYPQLKKNALPETQFTVSAPDENLRVAGKFLFPENLSMNLEPWRVPTNTLHQPFVSVTAVRGFAKWLKAQDWAPDYRIDPAPNQLFTWALASVPYQSFAAIPVPDGADALRQLFGRLKPKFDQARQQAGPMLPLEITMAEQEILLQGVPFAAPYMRAIKEPSGQQFLLAGAFPNSPRSKPLPPELFQRLAQKDLALYHWEITAERWPLLLNLSQLSMLLSGHRQLEGGSAAMTWFQKIAPQLGNTITEISQSGPAEMSFNRKGMGLFTAAEMFALGQWLENPAFPHCNLKLPPPRKMPKRNAAQPQIINIPAPAPAK